MTISRCSNRPTKQYNALHVSPECFDELASAVQRVPTQNIVLETEPDAVLILQQYVVVRKSA